MRPQEVAQLLSQGRNLLNYKESGNSMRPLIKHRQPIHLYPVNQEAVEKGDIVFVKVMGRYYTHKVHAATQESVLIGNNRNRMNGWTSRKNIYGIVTHVDGRPVPGAQQKVRTK